MDWTAVGSIFTALGVLLAVWQLRLNAKLSRSQFEESFDQQYRSLAMEIPVDALIGKTVPSEDEQHVRELVYNYLDLSNEQVYLRSKRRISKSTWLDWCDGIQANLQRPVFESVWREIKQEAPGTFSFLEALERCNYSIDPASKGFTRES